jgi:hypothetical protein
MHEWEMTVSGDKVQTNYHDKDDDPECEPVFMQGGHTYFIFLPPRMSGFAAAAREAEECLVVTGNTRDGDHRGGLCFVLCRGWEFLASIACQKDETWMLPWWWKPGEHVTLYVSARHQGEILVVEYIPCRWIDSRTDGQRHDDRERERLRHLRWLDRQREQRERTRRGGRNGAA